MLIDSHCHLDLLKVPDLGPIMAAAKAAEVEAMLSVATHLDRWQAMMDLIEPWPEVQASAGMHPLSDDIGRVDGARLRQQLAHPRVVAVGETGLDYHYQQATAQAQRESFALHLECAREVGKPVIVHTREASEDSLAIMRAAAPLPAGGVIHCFTETLDFARQALELGYHISFSGIISFRNAAALREVVAEVPLERILVETDSPYLAPVPHRGKPNQPAYVRQVAEWVAQIKGLSLAAVAEATSANYRRLFAASA